MLWFHFLTATAISNIAFNKQGLLNLFKRLSVG